MSEPVLIDARVSVGGVVVSIKAIGPADTFRSELNRALYTAWALANQQADARYIRGSAT